jgi:phosphoribosylformylglycinamidine synthase
MYMALKSISGKEPIMVWHADTCLPDHLDFIALPGGFSYGDYLRSGAMSARSPIMQEVKKAANSGVFTLGVCNGFQVLTEAGLLEGTLMRNRDLKFMCKTVPLKVNNNHTAFTKQYGKNSLINIPIAHHDGNYFADHATLSSLEDNDQVVFRYCDSDGNTTADTSPNGSLNNIAGIINRKGNVLGMMPHPERAFDPLTGNTDGKALFESVLNLAHA